MLGMELRKVPVDDEPRRCATDGLALDDAAAVVATVGTTSFASVDPVRALAEQAHAAGAWLHVDAAYAGSSWICPEERWVAGRRRARRLARGQPAQVAASCRWTARCSGRRGPTSSARRSRSRRSTSRSADDAVRARRLRARARSPLPLAQALGGAALLRREGLRALLREHVRLAGALRRLGRGRPRLGARARRSASASSSSAATAPTPRTRRSSSASNARRARSSSRTRSSTAGTCFGSRSATPARPRPTSAARVGCPQRGGGGDDRHDDERRPRLRGGRGLRRGDGSDRPFAPHRLADRRAA